MSGTPTTNSILSFPVGLRGWPENSGDDLLQLVNSSGTVVGWIDSKGTPQGTLASSGTSTSTSALNLKNFGAKGDTKLVFDVTTTASSAVITSLTANFTQSDVGKMADLQQSNNINSGTILSVQSSTQATLSVNAAQTQSNATLVYGTDDTTAINSWVTAIVGTSTYGGNAHVGYVPAGRYYFTKGMDFLCPAITGTPYGVQPSLQIRGDGAGSTCFQAAAPSRFTFTSSHTAMMDIRNNWASNLLEGFRIEAVASAAVPYNGSNQAIYAMSNTSHTTVQNVWATNFYGQNGNMSGWAINGTSEETYHDMAVENGDICLNLTALVKVTFSNVYCEGAGNRNLLMPTSSTALEELVFINCDFLQDSGSPACELSPPGTAGSVNFISCRFKVAEGTTVTTLFFAPTAASIFNFYGCTVGLNDTTANLTGLNLTNSNTTVNFFGGSIKGAGTGNAVTVGTGATFTTFGTSVVGNTSGTVKQLVVNSTATTVGAAGAAAVLPANPTGYLIVNVNGADQKIPYYNS